MKGSKTVKKLALNEMLEALEEPQKEPVFFSVRKVARMGSFETRKYTHLTRHCALHCTNKKTWCFSSISGNVFLITKNVSISCHLQNLQDEASQLMRVKVKTEREGKEGYVTLETVNGAPSWEFVTSLLSGSSFRSVKMDNGRVIWYSKLEWKRNLKFEAQ